MNLLRKILFPIVPVYWTITWFRNLLYDSGIKTSTSFNLPIICVGNLSVGGTGKTPMIEYLVKNVGPEYRIMSAIVDSAKRAVEKELDGEAEVERSKIAKERLYINLSDNESNVIVPDEQFESGRIIISQYLEGQSFHRQKASNEAEREGKSFG